MLHHTGTGSNTTVSIETKMRNLQAFSQNHLAVTGGDRSLTWTDVPYHFYIDHAGHIAQGRDVGFVGDTNTNYDTAGYIQIVVEGNFEKEKPAPEQLESLSGLLVWLMLAWNLNEGEISVHGDHAATVCPGEHFMEVLPKVLADVAERRQSAVADLCVGNPSAEFMQLYCGTRR